jgi:hypothetical protein
MPTSANISSIRITLALQPKEGFEFSGDDVEIRILRREAESLVMGDRPAVSLTADPAPIENATAPADPAARPVPE